MTIGTDFPYLPQDLVTVACVEDPRSRPLVCRVTGVKAGRFLLTTLEGVPEKPRTSSADQMTLLEHGAIWKSAHAPQRAVTATPRGRSTRSLHHIPTICDFSTI